MANKLKNALPHTIACVLACAHAHAYNFETDSGIQGAWVTNATTGIGVRTKSPSCSLTGDPNAYGCGDSANTAQWSNGDDGNLNYKKGQIYTGYVSLTSELLLTDADDGLKFLARGTGIYDFAAQQTQRTDLSSAAHDQIVSNLQLLDLWIQKDFDIADKRAYARLGNQVVNWGESYFASGGINNTNSLDWQRLLIPGTQLKQALLPAPMLTVGSDLSSGLSAQAYLQFQWNSNRYPPVGSYWSLVDVYGKGITPAWLDENNFNVGGLDSGVNSVSMPYREEKAGNKPQYGLRIGYKPDWIDASFGFYYERYTDKAPVQSYLADGSGLWSYLGDRDLFGLSTNFSVGDWAIGAELSYRPHDAVALSGCFSAGGPSDVNTNGAVGIDCPAYRDEKKFQYDINAQKYLTQTSDPWLHMLGATQATATAELTWIRYPGVSAHKQYSRSIDGQSIYQIADAGYMIWLKDDTAAGYPIIASQGTANSMGLALDFNWTYDGTLIPGWAVTPGVTFYDALRGYTPTFSANYEQGAKSANIYVYFNQNPAVWQAGMNYSAYFGGNALSQPYSDRNFIGAFVTRNF